MELKATVDRHKHIILWMKLWNGGLLLTEKEQVFLGEILYKTMELQDKGIEEPYLGQIVFSTKSLGEIKEKLKLSKQGLNNYKKQLRDKGVIKKDEDGIYHINPRLIPQTELTYRFEYGRED